MNNLPLISPEKAQKILADNGMQVSVQQASDLVKFITTLALATKDNEERISVHTSKHIR